MTPKQVVNKIISHKPSCVEDVLRNCELPLKFLGDGAYRTAYQVVNTDIIIKFANSGFAMEHSLKEYKAAKTIKESKLTKYRTIKKHMPEIYHYDVETGISVGRFYKLLPAKANGIRERLAEKIRVAVGVNYTDLENSGNVGKDRRGILKIIDAGFINVG